MQGLMENNMNSIVKVLKDWDKGPHRLHRRILFEMPRLRHRWGFLVLLVKIADPKTGFLKISIRDLVTLTGVDRKIVYTTLKDLENAGYIKYTPAKNGHKKQVLICVLGMEKYLMGKHKKEDGGVLCIDKKGIDLLELQREFLRNNKSYRDDIIKIVRDLFLEKLNIYAKDDLLYGNVNSILERFLVDDIVKQLREIKVGKNIENAIGCLIMRLENKGE